MTDPRSNVFDMWPAGVLERDQLSRIFADTDFATAEDIPGNPLPGVWDAVVEFVVAPSFFVGFVGGLTFAVVGAYWVAF
jgi:hypothetical protein